MNELLFAIPGTAALTAAAIYAHRMAFKAAPPVAADGVDAPAPVPTPKQVNAAFRKFQVAHERFSKAMVFLGAQPHDLLEGPLTEAIEAGHGVRKTFPGPANLIPTVFHPDEIRAFAAIVKQTQDDRSPRNNLILENATKTVRHLVAETLSRAERLTAGLI